jgi:hypothetical protein
LVQGFLGGFDETEGFVDIILNDFFAEAESSEGLCETQYAEKGTW